VPGYRYAQFCPLARAAEIFGHRWTLLIVRELLLGPRRFSDLRRPLTGVSTSVLSQRLAELEERGIVAQRATPPPTPAVLYELTDLGRALEPAVLELARWGLRLLGDPQPGDHMDPGWLGLGLRLIARRGPTPGRSFVLAVPDDERELAFHVRGGRGGTVVTPGAAPADVEIRAQTALPLYALASGALSPAEALATGRITADGDLAVLDDFPALFDLEASPNP
jgi:DNA-binding HxlR family transcriptional regulator